MPGDQQSGTSPKEGCAEGSRYLAVERQISVVEVFFRGNIAVVRFDLSFYSDLGFAADFIHSREDKYREICACGQISRRRLIRRIARRSRSFCCGNVGCEVQVKDG